jgi:hypothetical protein
VVKKKDTAHLLPVEDRPPGYFPDGGAHEEIKKIIAANGQYPIEPVGAGRRPNGREQEKEDIRLMMVLPEDISQQEIEGEVDKKQNTGPG